MITENDAFTLINPLRRVPGMYARWQEKAIRRGLETTRVVILPGARQTGKSTLAMFVADANTTYHNLDEARTRKSARDAPDDFVRHGRKTMIIDEVQKAPDLLSQIKHTVDIDKCPGQFLLTGSADVLALPSVNESLAGRAEVTRLRPLTRGEILGTQPTFFERAFGLEFRARERSRDHLADPNGARLREAYLALAMAGGYPDAIARSHDGPLMVRWHRNYLGETLVRDMRDAANVRRQNAMRTLLARLAGWSSKGLDAVKIGRGLDISRPTLHSYINTIEMMLVIDRVPAWVDTDYEWGMRRDRLFMSDSGLMAGTLGWSLEEARTDADISGKLLETYVHNQLAALVDVHDPHYSLFHYRDKVGREVDFVVRHRSGNLLGIEVKAATAVGREDARHLLWFGKNIAKGRQFVGLVLHTGGGVHRLEENVWAAPISILWEE